MYSLTKKSKGNILLYQTEDGQTKIEVTLTNDTVWLTTDLMAELFNATSPPFQNT